MPSPRVMAGGAQGAAHQDGLVRVPVLTAISRHTTGKEQPLRELVYARGLHDRGGSQSEAVVVEAEVPGDLPQASVDSRHGTMGLQQGLDRCSGLREHGTLMRPTGRDKESMCGC